jgi:hypothetical protein
LNKPSLSGQKSLRKNLNTIIPAGIAGMTLNKTGEALCSS